MGTIREWFDGFDLGEFLGVGLDSAQIAGLSVALFLVLFAVAALRRVTTAGGPLAALWVALATGLFAGGVLAAARTFPDQIPDDLRTWIDPDRLLRATVVVALLGCSFVFLSAFWARCPTSKLVIRLVGLFFAGAATWLMAGWFADHLPDEARPWAARSVVTRLLVVSGLLCMAVSFWLQPAETSPHVRWRRRILASAAVGLAVILATQWFGLRVVPDLEVATVQRVAVLASCIAAGTCAAIALGAYFLRERPRKAQGKVTTRGPSQNVPVAARPLPVAILLDDFGRPVLPYATPHPGS